jgi:hypothetical protein
MEYDDNITSTDLDNLRLRFNRSKLEDGEVANNKDIKLLPKQDKPQRIANPLKNIKIEAMSYTVVEPDKLNIMNKGDEKGDKRGSKLKIKKGNKKEDKFGLGIEQSLIARYKNTKLVRAHKNATVDTCVNSETMRIDPTNGVNYQPDLNNEEIIKGKPYKSQQREFQNKFLEEIGSHKPNMPQTKQFSITKSPSSIRNVEQYLEESGEYGNY